jgi:hypothetical protein
MRAWMLIAAVAIAGCTESRAPRTIGAVCMRAKNLADAAHAERVQVTIALKERGPPAAGDLDPAFVALAGRCRATLVNDDAVREVYPIILDSQLVTVDAWKPLSDAAQKLVPRPDACDAIEKADATAFAQVRAWAESMQLAHNAAYEACRALAK